MKDLKVWSTFRTETEIQKFRYKMLNPVFEVQKRNSLNVYMPLNENHYKIHNLAHLLNNSIPIEGLISGFDYVIADTELSGATFKHFICPLGTYLRGKSCELAPISEILTTVYPFMNGTELVWKFSPDSSPGYQESSWDDINVLWSI